MANEFKVRKGLIVQGSGSNIFDVQGSQGQLFSVTDSLSGSLFSVNDISGIPIMEVFSDNTIKLGTFNQEAIIVSGSRTGMGVATPQAKLHISGASNSGLFEIDSPAVNNIIYVSGSGNVGIGTTNPGVTLDVSGNIRSSGVVFSSTTQTQNITINSAAQLQFRNTSSVEVGRFDNAGNWGIGTTSPTSRLQVRGSGATSATTALTVENSAATARLTILDDGTSAFNTSHLYISSSGNIGIGLTSPLAKLHISGANSLRMQNTGFDTFEWFFSAGTGIGFRNVTDGTTPFFVGGTDDIGIGTTNTSARLHISGASNSNLLRVGSPTDSNILFITGSGNVGIGTTTPTVRLHISGTSATNELVHLIGDASQGSAIRFNRGSSYSWRMGVVSNSNFTIEDVSYSTVRFQINNTSGLIGINTTSPNARLHISGANNEALLIVSSSTAPSALFVSGSGRVGVGTTTPRQLLHVAGGNIALDGTQFIDFGNGNSRINDLGLVSGQGYPITISTFGPIGTGTANSLTEKLRLTGSGSLGLGTTLPSARFHISGGFTDGNLMRVQSPTGAEYFFISASGNVGIGTATPVHNLVVDGNTGVSINAGGATFPNIHRDSADGGMLLRSWNGSTFTNNVKITPTTEVGIGTTTPTAELHISGASNAGLFEIDSPAVNNIIYVSGSGNVGMGTNLPSADLHISGASADSLLRVGSPTNPDILFVNGNGRVGINTTSSAGFLGGNISTFTIFQNSGSGDGLTPSTGLQIVNSGSSTSAQAQLSIVTVGDKFAAFNIGTSGSGTQNNYWHLSKRNAAGSHALNLYNNNQGSFSGPLFSFISAGTSTLGENNQIRIDDATGRVGLQVTPSDFIHLYSEPGGGSYLRIDATSVQAPPVNLASAKSGFGIIANDYFLAEPDYWMEIKLDGTVVLIPCYLPG